MEPGIVFASLALFDKLRFPLIMYPMVLASLAQVLPGVRVMVSHDR